MTDIATLMSGTALSSSEWAANAGGTKGSQQRGSEGDNPIETAIKAAIGKALPQTVDKIEALRDRLDASGRSRLLIDREERAGRFIYRILNPDTGETMRQWPPEGYLDLIAFLRDGQGGVVDQRV
ncbi:flagellar protein FlaG [Alkalicaulis satelles]|uniref:Flagellar protein FlaG n=1 Tax=Alkalicaulis satelles TaxID=2609175 RepID=A0A5M6ZBX9_9PROT|nr:flagellar protein FlaG [Alkalicaulis satelles]KAA5802223.1 flagellar protein FlaG [Alkalicaulis satelles]